MARVAYRFTFLDVLLEGEDRAQESHGCRGGRAHSAPPRGETETGASTEEAGFGAEAGMRRYAQSLPKPKGGLRGPENVGSLGHPLLCQRACVHAAAGRHCEAGDGCEFCHVPHTRGMKLDGHLHRHMEAMSKADFLCVTLRLLRNKAHAAGLRDEALEALEALFSVFTSELQREKSAKSEKPEKSEKSQNREPGELLPNKPFPRRLLRYLLQASFAAVVSLAARKCGEEGRLQAREAMQALRIAQGSAN